MDQCNESCQTCAALALFTKVCKTFIRRFDSDPRLQDFQRFSLIPLALLACGDVWAVAGSEGRLRGHSDWIRTKIGFHGPSGEGPDSLSSLSG